MYTYIYIYIYIQHWRILWSCYRKLAWAGLEPTTTEFRSDSLSDWAIRPWVQLALRVNFVHFVQLPQFHCLFSVVFHFVSRHFYFDQNFSWGNHISKNVEVKPRNRLLWKAIFSYSWQNLSRLKREETNLPNNDFYFICGWRINFSKTFSILPTTLSKFQNMS